MITIKEIEKLAALSRIELSEEEKIDLQKDMDSILAYVETIKKVDVSKGEAVLDSHRNIFREDGEPHESGIYTETLLNAAPHREGQYVSVKKIL